MHSQSSKAASDEDLAVGLNDGSSGSFQVDIDRPRALLDDEIKFH